MDDFPPPIIRWAASVLSGKLVAIKTCPGDPQNNDDTYTQLYNYYGYQVNATYTVDRGEYGQHMPRFHKSKMSAWGLLLQWRLCAVSECQLKWRELRLYSSNGNCLRTAARRCTELDAVLESAPPQHLIQLVERGEPHSDFPALVNPIAPA